MQVIMLISTYVVTGTGIKSEWDEYGEAYFQWIHSVLEWTKITTM